MLKNTSPSGSVTATVKLRADTLPDFNSVLAIIKEAGLPVSIEEVILHEKSGPYFWGSVKPPSEAEIYLMVEEWKKKPGVPGDEEEEHF